MQTIEMMQGEDDRRQRTLGSRNRNKKVDQLAEVISEPYFEGQNILQQGAKYH